MASSTAQSKEIQKGTVNGNVKAKTNQTISWDDVYLRSSHSVKATTKRSQVNLENGSLWRHHIPNRCMYSCCSLAHLESFVEAIFSMLIFFLFLWTVHFTTALLAMHGWTWSEKLENFHRTKGIIVIICYGVCLCVCACIQYFIHTHTRAPPHVTYSSDISISRYRYM